MSELSPPTLSGAASLLLLLTGAPLLAALALALLALRGGAEGERTTRGIATAGLSLGLLGALGLAGGRAAGALPEELTIGTWLRLGQDRIDLGLLLDGPGLALLGLGATFTLLVARFSAGYLHRDGGFRRFYALLCLFSGALAVLCLANDALLTYAGWEGVGLCSALLIGFFRERPAAAAAGTRAFATNRLGDAGFLLGLVLCMVWIGDTRWTAIRAGSSALSVSQATAIGACLLLAAMAKSGQVPLSSWLFRAMEGPTPSSALFYGAVAVHAAVLLLLRAAPILAHGGPAALAAVGVGLCTALFGWGVGLTQTDIKSSLISASIAQLGLMVVWCGLGLETLALAHMIAHGVVRGWQILHAPSVVEDLGLAPTRAITGRLAGSRSLYMASLSRFWLDELTQWAVVDPLKRLGRQLDALDAHFVDRATGLPLRRAFTGLASARARPEPGAELSQGRGLMGWLTQRSAAILDRIEDRLVLRAIGRGIPEAGGRLGVLLGRVEMVLGQPWVVALIVIVTLLLVW